jgi:hypothetical protein
MSSVWGNDKFLNILVWRRQENKGLGNRRHTYKAIIKMDFKWGLKLSVGFSWLGTGYSD